MTDPVPGGLNGYTNVPKDEVPGVVAMLLDLKAKHIDIAIDGDETYSVTPSA
ncbi:hypothetical protein [uncultured Caulobacter sp.]|uniref:hypothetical protein n=1 Tax=uncultured Caulobacter sp. TaxID=158749 RepID=UPI00260BD865|nr:hypothetical protein [uncultured Caulobacter sp.]